MFLHRLLHRIHLAAVHEYCHILYFAGVFIEGHGFYTYAAGALLVVNLVGMFGGHGGVADEVE